jgi:opacity protein-like surface antigen
MRVRRSLTAAAFLVLFAGTPDAARAEGFISPFIGHDFSGASGCPSISGCRDKRINAGASIGALGDIFGFEEEFAYAKSFFGEAPQLSSSVFTMMSNAQVAPKIGPVRPYALAGLGLMKTHVEFAGASLLSSDNNNFAWDAGGGVTVYLGGHVGIRADVRHFHAFQDLSALGFTVEQSQT